MKLFEDLMEASAKFADKATKVAAEAFEQTKVVAEEAMDKGKKKVNEMALENDLSKAQKQLGELYYVMRKTGEMNEDLLTQYFNAALEVEAKLDALKLEEINVADDYSVEEVVAEEDVVGEAVEEVKEFVEEVKADVAEAIEEVKEAMGEEAIELSVKVCPSCGAAADDTDIFCRECGSKING